MTSAPTLAPLNSDLTQGPEITQAPGASYLAALYYLEEKGRAPYNSATEIVQDIIGYGFIEAHSSCAQAQLTTQTVSINCDDAGKAADVRNSSNCDICRHGVKDLMNQRQTLEDKALELNPKYVRQSPSQSLNEELRGTNATKDAVDFDGICKFMCFQCVAEDIEQVASIKMDLACKSFGSNFKTSYVTGMYDRARQHVKNNAVALQQLGYDLRKQASVDQFALHMSNTIANMTSSKTYDTLFQQGINVQAMTIDSGSTSVVIQNASQSITNKMMASIAGQVFNEIDVKNTINYNDKSTQFDKTAQFGNLVEAATKGVTSVRRTIESSIGKILMAIVIVLSAVLILVGIYLYKKRKGAYANEPETNDSDG